MQTQPAGADVDSELAGMAVIAHRPTAVAGTCMCVRRLARTAGSRAPLRIQGRRCVTRSGKIWALIVKLAIKVEEGGTLPIHDVAFPMRVVVGAPLLYLGPPRTHPIALEYCPSRGVTHSWVLWIPNKPKVAMQRLVEVLGDLVFLAQTITS